MNMKELDATITEVASVLLELDKERYVDILSNHLEELLRVRLDEINPTYAVHGYDRAYNNTCEARGLTL